jgi:hypothetical protein
MTEQEHFIEVKALHEYSGGFDEDLIGTEGQMDLEFQKEVSITFECYCGERFYKRKRAEEHLLEQ